MSTEGTTYRINNRLLRSALLGISDVLGDRALKAILREAGLEYLGLPLEDDQPAITFEEYAALDAAVHKLYGPRAAGLLKRIGEAVFFHNLHEQAFILRLLAQSIKVLPERQRVKALLQQMAKGIAENTYPQQEAWVEEEGDTLALCLRPCGLCTGRQSDKPLGHFLVGSIQAAVSWALGKRVEVAETHCMAMGDDHGRVEIRLP